MKSFLSLILAVSLVVSLFTINVMAATNTMTIVSDKTTGLTAGDTITVEITIDGTADIKSMEYALAYDTDVFEVDMNQDAYQDYDWYLGIVSKSSDPRNKIFGDYLTMDFSPKWDWDNGRLLSAGETGKIKYAWMGSTPIPTGKNEANKVIGKFYIKVKGDVANGTTSTLSLTGLTNGEPVTTAPVTITLGEAAGPVVTPPTFVSTEADADATTGVADGVAITGTNKKFDNAFAITASIKPGSATEVGMLFIPDDVADKSDANWAKATYTGEVAGKGDVEFTAAIKNIPRALEGTDFDMLSKAYAKIGEAVSYGNVVRTTINFGSTGEVE